MSLVGFKITNHPQQVGLRGANDTVDERITPDRIFLPLQAEFGFNLDAAANAANRKCAEYFDLGGNGLAHSWRGYRVWCNPPYSNIRPWVEKAWVEHRDGCDLIAMLLPANRCEQGWWQDLIEPFRDGRGPLETRFFRSRFNFGLPDNPEGRFHSSPHSAASSSSGAPQSSTKQPPPNTRNRGEGMAMVVRYMGRLYDAA